MKPQIINNMKTKLLILLVIILSSCVHPVLNSKEYKIIDTLKIRYGNFGKLEGADVIIKYDSTYHYGILNKRGNLMEMSPRNLKVKNYK